MAASTSDTLRLILKIARSIQQHTAPLTRPTHAVENSQDSGPLRLPEVTDTSIREKLVGMKVPDAIRERLCESYKRHAEKLAISFVEIYERHHVVPRQVRAMYENRLSEWEKGIIKQVREKSGKNLRKESRKKISNRFNTNFIPALEACFAKEQFPSRADKLMLAERSGMTYQQVHIWFQNRRSRMKKVAGRSENSDAQKLSSSNSRRNEGVRTVGDSTKFPSVMRESDCFTLKWRAPSHAYPTIYPPELDDQDPYPCRFGDFSMFAKPCWKRAPALAPPSGQGVVDVDSLMSQFAKLSIMDTERKPITRDKGGTARQSAGDRPSHGVAFAFIVRPLRAPLDSLVRNFPPRGTSQCKAADEARAIHAALTESGQLHSSLKLDERPASARSYLPSSQPTQEHVISPVRDTVEGSVRLPMKIINPNRKSSLAHLPFSPSSSRCKRSRKKPAKETVRHPTEPPAFHSSPARSTESLPSLLYSSGSSSASEQSQSPIPSFATLSDEGSSSSLDAYQPSSLSLTLPESLVNEYPPPIFASDFSINFSKDPLDYTFSAGLHSCPSYSDSLDAILRGLQSSADIGPPCLTFDLPSLAR